jgi:formylmethanofuran dehydrogenase subunit D
VNAMNHPSKDGLRRMTVTFPPEATAALADIMKMSRLKENTQVITAAVGCYLNVLKVDRNDGKIIVRDKNDDTRVWPFSPDIEFNYPKYQEKRDTLKTKDNSSSAKNFAFAESLVRKIEEAQRLTHYTSKADVIRASLATFHELVEVKNNGDKILVKKADGSVTPFSPFSSVVTDEAIAVI